MPLFYEPLHISEFHQLLDAAWDAHTRNSSLSSTRNVRHCDSQSTPVSSRPLMDLHESREKNEMTATFELPGVKKEDISIDVHNNRLVISGHHNVSETVDKADYAVRERRFGRFTRTLPLPVGTKHEDVKASMENGILTVKFPRTQPEQEAHRITIA